MSVLTKEDKAGLINQHKRNIELNKFNLELTLIEENALSTPKAEVIADLEAQIDEQNLKLAALDAELAAL